MTVTTINDVPMYCKVLLDKCKFLYDHLRSLHPQLQMLSPTQQHNKRIAETTEPSTPSTKKLSAMGAGAGLQASSSASMLMLSPSPKSLSGNVYHAQWKPSPAQGTKTTVHHRSTSSQVAVHCAAAAMRYHASLLGTMALAATPSGTAFQASVAGLTASRRSTASSTSRVRVSMSWRGLLDGVMGRSTDSKQKKGGSSGVLTPKSRVKLGDLSVSPMGLGTWAWGNKLVWGYDDSMDAELQEAFNLCVSEGINWFDTADSYGTGKIVGQAERLLGKFVREYPGDAKVRGDLQIATKFAPYPYRIGSQSIITACDETLERVEADSLGVGQLHWAPPLGWQEEAYWEGLAKLKAAGRIREVGLSNYGPKGVARAHRFLAKLDTPLASNQVQFSLISRYPLDNGLLDTAKSLGVTSIAYSPLGLGLLTGKYNSGNIPSGPRGIIFRRVLPTMGPLLAVMGEISEARGKTMSQVALNWCVCKGTVPIVGVKTLAQARENLGALGWQLSPEEVEGLDDAAGKIKKQSVQNVFQST